MFADLSHAMQVLETCGLAFAHIPAGDYAVGYEGEGLLAKPPQISFISPAAMPLRQVTVDEFWISEEPLRLSQWRKIVSHPGCSSLVSLVPSAHLKEIAARWVTEPEVTVVPSESEQQTDPDTPSRCLAQQVELDPVLLFLLPPHGEPRAGLAGLDTTAIDHHAHNAQVARAERFFSRKAAIVVSQLIPT